jgi:hypothetical protein
MGHPIQWMQGCPGGRGTSRRGLPGTEEGWNRGRGHIANFLRGCGSPDDLRSAREQVVRTTCCAIFESVYPLHNQGGLHTELEKRSF